MTDYMEKAAELELRINDKREMDSAIEAVCAYCFKHMQIDCESCPVGEMEKMVWGVE